MPEGANTFNLYDIIDQTPPTGLTDDIDKESNGENDQHTAPSTFAFNASTFDTMLEVLPDDVGLNIPAFSGAESVPDSDGKRQTSKDINDDDIQGITNSNLGMEGLDDTNLQSHMDLMPPTRPIDIASNQLSGEIAPLWDFKMEDFMMTPAPGDFNSSAPNSFNSNRHFLQSESAPTGQHGSFNGFGSTGFNLTQTLGMGMPQHHFNYNQSTSSSPKTGTNHFNNSNTNGNNNYNHNTDDNVTFNTPQRENSFSQRHSIGSRKPSNQFSKTVHTEDGGIALSSSTTTNSVKKNSLVRQVSSTSLSNYKRGSSSGIPDLPKKPPIQCYNCKTNKTPLWRRDAQGNTMCNACGLFQKLHGTMRPLSLKSDVIKKRNTKKRTEKEKQSQEHGNQSNNTNTNNNNNNTNNNNTKNSRQSTRKNARGSIHGNNDSGGVGGFPVLTQSITVPVTSFETGVAGSPIVSSLENRSQQLQASSQASSQAQSQSQYERQQNVTTESLNPYNLMDHNKKMASSNTQCSRKSRRSSTSSNNSSSSKSFSRSVVPILPKPSPGAPQFNVNYNGSSSAGNSAASSPRVFAAGCNPESPMNSCQQTASSNSASKTGISIPRPKSSRNYSSSSSFMAASLHQLQQQHQKQEQPQQHQQSPNVQMGSGGFSMPNSWNSGSQTSIGYSPNSTRSPKGGFDFVGSPVDSSGPGTRTGSRKSHTSLLSQQLQNSALYNEEMAHQQGQSEAHTPNVPQSNGSSNVGTPQPVPLGRNSVTASPRNSYADSLLQQRGMKDELGSSFRRQNSVWARKNVSLKEHVISSNAEATVCSNPNILAATPTVSTTASPAASGETSTEAHKNITDELDWLKFKM
ncbi:hypothetical protein ZYGR_0P03650 [Zygosaccharomyces rouxii]|uniref:ZYRO0E08910p n=2 Tax=Zygosaccharomyces rouxii TaxID=4956 RepID=C5E4U8_ZYGRC|nr:uncharacterized protein ZYRO0E08910g [Zygosaccharomyces rouxii]KAH9198085.1 hypothetical protein LQ764DRAFT_146317 [Zygosaccharomyces rouxii]GAV49719.1 hypothetical protein ZYGR_0P03650 [Zygosaccharomyces rouxii]CAR31059.1 ZYRO0E08910p [Zygosaccharomyces rouxii]